MCLMIVALIIGMIFANAPTSSEKKEGDLSLQETLSSATEAPSVLEASTSFPEESQEESTEIQTKPIPTTAEESETEAPSSEWEDVNTTAEESVVPEIPDITMDDALFIGDSRTVGLKEYTDIEGADFFCSVGMSVYSVRGTEVYVSGVGNVYLKELLQRKEYGKIYIMLGINEVGYEHSDLLAKYSQLMELVQTEQPEAMIFIQGNLHVTKKRSDRDKIVNNPAIDNLNEELSKYADGETKFYLDVNELFDDETGNLTADLTGDGTHLYAKHYPQWAEWIIEQTAILCAGKITG